MKNHYEIKGNITTIFLKSSKHGDMETIINTSDLDKVKTFSGSWYPHWNKCAKTFYVQGRTRMGKGKTKTFILHRIVTDAPKGLMVDHINHDTLNNTRDNLRIVTNAQNQQNRKSSQANSKSGVRGVNWHKASKKWRAQINVNKNNIYLGLFDNIEDAEKATKEARGKHMSHSLEAAVK